MRRLAQVLCTWITLGSACSLSAQTLSEPERHLPGQSYEQEAAAISDMLRNVAGDMQAVKTELDARTPTTDLLNANNTWRGTNQFVTTISTFTRATLAANVGRAGALGPAVDTSTISFTLPVAGDVDLSFNGICQANSGGGSLAYISMLIDGAFPGGYSPTVSVMAMAQSLTTPRDCHVFYTARALTAGSHTFSLTLGSDGAGTMTISCATHPCQFQARSVP